MNVAAFNLPQFNQMFVSNIPLSVNPQMAMKVANIILETFDDHDDPAVYAMAKQLKKYAVNCDRFLKGLPPILQKEPQHRETDAEGTPVHGHSVNTQEA